MTYFNSYDIGLSTLGGIIIGIATSIHMILKGRVTGFSGLLYSIISFERNNFIWKLALILSVIASSASMFKYYGFLL